MRHLRKFNTQTNYNDVKSSLALPNMCLLNDTYEIASESDEDIVPIEYLQATGTQYIDIGIAGDKITRFVIEGTCVSTSNASKQLLGSNKDGLTTFFGCYNTNNWFCMSDGSYIGDSRNRTLIDATLGETNYGTLYDKATNIQLSFDSIQSSSWGFDSSNLILFGGGQYRKSISASCYNLKLYTANGLVRDFIPVRVNQVGYMYDKVSKKLFANVGTGNFTLGPDDDPLKFKNAITNGYGEMLNNYNFSGFTFDINDYPSYCNGSFVCNIKTTKFSDEYISLRRGSTLKLKYWVKNTTDCTNYDFISQYDSDKNEIRYDNWHWVNGSTTYLTQPLNDGDTVVHLADVSVYKTTTNTSKGFIIWNYKNSTGYEYPKETYSRNKYTNLWNDASTDINTTNNTITLKTAWNNGNIPAGTFISHYQSGGTYHYGNVGYKTTVDTWVEKTATFNTTIANSLSKGTAYVKIGWLINYNNISGNIFKISGIRLIQEKHL